MQFDTLIYDSLTTRPKISMLIQQLSLTFWLRAQRRALDLVGFRLHR